MFMSHMLLLLLLSPLLHVKVMGHVFILHVIL